MDLYQLPKLNQRSKKRLGRGLGSGRGKTSGRGTKGAKARGSIPLGFIGGTLALYKRLPFRRGVGNPKISSKSLAVDVAKLSAFKANSTVNLESLLEQKVISKKDLKSSVKIVGNKGLTVALKVLLPVSKSARQVITKAGGEVD